MQNRNDRKGSGFWKVFIPAIAIVLAFATLFVLVQKAYERISLLESKAPKYQILAGTLRYSDALKTWEFIKDDTHEPLGIRSVTVENNRINIYYDFTAKKVLSLIATPDDTYVLGGLMAGTTVGRSTASIYLQQDPGTTKRASCKRSSPPTCRLILQGQGKWTPTWTRQACS